MIKDIVINNSTLILLENGDLWGCGQNKYGELGLGNTIQLNTFQKINEDVEKIKTSLGSTFVLKKNKTLWYAGVGYILKRKRNIVSFKKIADDVKDFLMFETLEGKFLFCLRNDEVLVDLLNNKTFLTDVKNLKIKSKDGKTHLFAIKNDNSLWKFEEQTFVKVLDDVKDIFLEYNLPSFIQKPDNSLWQIKGNDFKKIVKVFDDVKDINFSTGGCFVLNKDNVLFAFGKNICNRFGIDKKYTKVFIPINQNIKKFYLDYLFSLILKEDNSLWGCGRNYHNILGNESDNFRFCSFKKLNDDVKNFYTNGYSLFIVKQNGDLWGSGEVTNYLQGSDFLKFISKDVEKIFFTPFCYFISKKDNSLLCFGNNLYGKLGIGLKKEKIDKPIVNNTIKNYYNTKETIEVINNVFKEKSL